MAELTTKQKCEKLATVLETVAVKLRDEKLGAVLWETEELSIQTLVSKLSLILARAADITSDSPKGVRRYSKKSTKAKEVVDDWPDIID